MPSSSEAPPTVPTEPLTATLTRNFAIAAIAATALSIQTLNLHRWLTAFIIMLWPTLGGHFLELGFLKLMAPQLRVPALQRMARVMTWFAGGALMTLAIHATAQAIRDPRFVNWPPVWLGAIGLVGIELIVHLALRARGLPQADGGTPQASDG